MNQNIIDFLHKIDCNFPYQDTQKVMLLIHEAKSLGIKTILAILYEVANVPYSVNVSQTSLMFILDKVDNLLGDKYAFLTYLVQLKIQGYAIGSKKILEGMLRVEAGSYDIITLNILYSLDIENCSELVEMEYQRISEKILALEI